MLCGSVQCVAKKVVKKTKNTREKISKEDIRTISKTLKNGLHPQNLGAVPTPCDVPSPNW